MCPEDAPVAGGVRRWRPEACTCGPDMPCSGAGGRWAPQMILNNRITARLPRGGVVEGGAEIGFSGNRTKNNFWPPAGKGKRESQAGKEKRARQVGRSQAGNDRRNKKPAGEVSGRFYSDIQQNYFAC